MIKSEPASMFCEQPLPARNMRENVLARMARDLSVRADALENFLAGKSLPSDKLIALTKILFNDHAEFLPDVNMLRSVNLAEPRSMGIRPPSVDASTTPKFAGGPPELFKTPLPGLRPPQPRLHPGWTE